MCYTDNNYEKIQKPQEEMTVKQSLSFARRLAALVLAAVMLCVAVPAAFAEDAAPGATTIGGANTTLIPEEEENCLSWLFGSKDKITLPYLNIKGKGLRRNVSLDLVDCLVGITYTELGSIGSYVSASAAQEAWKAQAVAIHSSSSTISSTAPRPTPSFTPPWRTSRPRPGRLSARRWSR